MAAESLFERLRKAVSGSSHPAEESHQARVRSIGLNLTNLFNSWAGHAPAQMDLGMPAPSEIAHNYPGSITDVQRAIRTCIEKYEPRLTNVRVMHVEGEGDSLQIRFQIDAQLAGQGQAEKFSFDTLVDHAGQVMIEG